MNIIIRCSWWWIRRFIIFIKNKKVNFRRSFLSMFCISIEFNRSNSIKKVKGCIICNSNIIWIIWSNISCEIEIEKFTISRTWSEWEMRDIIWGWSVMNWSPNTINLIYLFHYLFIEKRRRKNEYLKLIGIIKISKNSINAWHFSIQVNSKSSPSICFCSYRNWYLSFF